MPQRRRRGVYILQNGIEAPSKEGKAAVERVRLVYDKRRKLMAELMRDTDFNIPVMPQGALYVFADASKWTDDSDKFTFELLEKARYGHGAKRGLRPRRASGG